MINHRWMKEQGRFLPYHTRRKGEECTNVDELMPTVQLVNYVVEVFGMMRIN